MMELKGKKVLVVGLGKSGLAAALFLRRRGAQVTVSDIARRVVAIVEVDGEEREISTMRHSGEQLPLTQQPSEGLAAGTDR